MPFLTFTDGDFPQAGKWKVNHGIKCLIFTKFQKWFYSTLSLAIMVQVETEKVSGT